VLKAKAIVAAFRRSVNGKMVNHHTSSVN
jgi:hypothetical protein